MEFSDIFGKGAEAVIVSIATGIGAWAHKLITKVYKSEKDLNALWPRFRELEAKLKGECNDCRYHGESSFEARNGVSGIENSSPLIMGSSEENDSQA